VLHAKVFWLEAEVAMLREELRITGARMRRVDPRRLQYSPSERVAILELRAMRGWGKAETARRFFVSDGKTPNEVYFSRPPANEQPRFEPRDRWPRGSPCAWPLVDIIGQPGDPVVVEIDLLEGRRYLPVIRAKRAA